MRKIVAVCFIVLLLAVTSCQREVKPFLGDYSYKLSGEVAVTDSDGTVNYYLVHRNGQMNVLEDKTGSSRLLITMNEMNGACYTMSATVRGDSLILDPYEFTINILTQEGSNIFDSDNSASLVYRISSTGGGFLNDKILILNEVWNGYQSGHPNVVLHGPEMRIMAERN